MKLIFKIFFHVILLTSPIKVNAADSLSKIIEKYKIDPKTVTPINIKIATLAPANTPWIQIVYDKIIPKLREESMGLLEIKVYAGGVLGNDPDIVRKITMGQVHGCGCTALGITAAVPEMSVFTLPFLFRNYEEIDYIFKKFRPEIEKMFLKKGYYLAAIIDTGFFYVFTKERTPNLDALKKQKILTWFGEVETNTFSELGINPIPLPVPEITMGLQTGVVDSNISPPVWQLSTQAFKYTSFFIDQPFFYSPAAVFVDSKQIEKLMGNFPANSRQEIIDAIIEIIRGFEPEWKKEIRDYEKKCIDVFIKSGITPLTLPEQDIEKIKRASENVYKTLSGKLFSKKLIDNILDELKKFRKN